MLAIYIRVSTGKQAKEDKYSLTTQRNRGVSFARKVGEQYEIYEDVISGASLSRPSLDRLLADVRSGQVTKLWVIETSRISRDMEVWQLILKTLRENKVEWYVADEPKDLMKPDSILLLNIKAAVDQYERASILDRVTRNKNEARDRGNLVFQRMFGYNFRFTPDGKREVVVNAEEARVVERVFSDFIKGKKQRQIAQDLTEERIPTVRSDKTGRIFWHRLQVKEILTRRLYTGYTTDSRGNPIRSNHYQPIISEELFDEAQQRLVKIQQGMPTGTVRRESNKLCSGVVKCSACGKNFHWINEKKTKKGKLYHYQAYVARHADDCANRGGWIRKDRLDAILIRLYAREFSDNKSLDIIRAKMQSAIEREAGAAEKQKTLLEKELSKVKQKEQQFAAAFADEVIGKEAFLAQGRRLKAESFALEEEIERWEKEIKEKRETFERQTRAMQKIKTLVFLFAGEENQRRALLSTIKTATIAKDILDVEFITGNRYRVPIYEPPEWMKLANERVFRRRKFDTRRRNFLQEFKEGKISYRELFNVRKERDYLLTQAGLWAKKNNIDFDYETAIELIADKQYKEVAEKNFRSNLVEAVSKAEKIREMAKSIGRKS